MVIMDLLFFLGGVAITLLVKNFLPKYSEEKGKNLATKEDIADITKKTEEVKIQFQKDFNEYIRYSKFKEDYCYKQFSQLYSKLYAIICQSEYYRYVMKTYKGRVIPFEEAPFFEMSKSTIKEKLSIFTGEILEKQVVEVEDSITNFNKKQMCEFIIANADLASRKLLKLAVAYRYANDKYEGSKDPVNDDFWLDAFNKEEMNLINQIVRAIVSDYNKLARELKFDYNETEIFSGIFEDKELKF